MIFGTDTSRFQPLGTYDPGDFEIVNAEEPDGPGGGDFTATINQAIAQGRPWGVYLYLLHGQAVRIEAAIARVRHLYGQDPPLGYWVDYEEAGVVQDDYDQALVDAYALGVNQRHIGLYTYSNLYPSIDARGRALWLAYYPWPNDGTYQPYYSNEARRQGAVIHQYSSGGGLDRNVVLDEPWYAGLVHSTPAGDDMIVRAHGNSVINPDITDGSTWFVVTAGLLASANPAHYPGVIVVDVEAEDLARVSRPINLDSFALAVAARIVIPPYPAVMLPTKWEGNYSKGLAGGTLS